jgi:hypothetical protein
MTLVFQMASLICLLAGLVAIRIDRDQIPITSVAE